MTSGKVVFSLKQLNYSHKYGEKLKCFLKTFKKFFVANPKFKVVFKICVFMLLIKDDHSDIIISVRHVIISMLIECLNYKEDELVLQRQCI